jgi:hypothetical protein
MSDESTGSRGGGQIVIALSNAAIAGLAIILVILIVAFIAVLGRARRP